MSFAYAQSAPSVPTQGTTATTGTAAGSAAPVPVNDQIMAFLPLILIFGIFYLLILRPQQRRMKEHRTTVAGLQRGDKVVTAGGLIGTVSKIVNDDEVLIDLADNVRVRAVRQTISSVLGDEKALTSNAPVNDDESAVLNTKRKNG